MRRIAAAILATGALLMLNTTTATAAPAGLIDGSLNSAHILDNIAVIGGLL
jgi:hypothetical protein